MFDITASLLNRPEAVSFYDDFVSSDLYGKYVLGTNSIATSISDSYEIDGFIDNRFAGQVINNQPVFDLEQIPADSLVVSTITGVLPVTFKKRLDERGIRNINYLEFLKMTNFDLPSVWYLGQVKEDLMNNLDSYQKVYSLLNDEESQDTFEKLINFKLSGNLDHMIDFTDIQDEQYFDSVLNLEDDEIFVDVGGFDGYTSSEFARRCPHYNAIHFFEPDKENLTSAKLNLSELKNIHYYQYGLSSKKSVFRFSSNGSSSHISDKGGFEINVDKLDDLLDEPYTFLKMDIEGAEGAAIDGAKESILRHHPKLAISVYHKVDDFWKIPLQILNIREDYKIYMRHYTEGFTETVMFFIPIK